MKKKINKQSKLWEDVNIDNLNEGVKIKFRDSIPKTTIEKGDILIINSYAVWHSRGIVDMTFTKKPNICCTIPYYSFDIITH